MGAETRGRGFRCSEIAALVARDGKCATADSLMTKVSGGACTSDLIKEAVAAKGSGTARLAQLRRMWKDKERRGKLRS